MNVFVTGGAGYIGSHVVKLLGEKGFNILTCDNLSTGNRWAVACGRFVKIDLSDKQELEEIIRDFKPDIVVHLAASVVVSESITYPMKYYSNNTVNTLNLIECMLKCRVNKIIYSSTAAVYGNPEIVPVSEDAPLRPINPYGQSKAMSELMLQDICGAKDDFRYVSLRYFNVAGADKDSRIGQSCQDATHLITRALKAANGEIEKLPVYGTDYLTRDGTCIRDYIHVDDIAKAHLMAIRYLFDGGNSNAFNCGYGHGFSVKEVVNMTKKVTGTDFNTEELGRRVGDPPVLISDNSKIKTMLGWMPEFDDLEYIIRTAWLWEQRLSGMSHA